VVGFFAAIGAIGCNKQEPGASGDAPSTSAAAPAAASSAPAAVASAAPASGGGEALAGLDPCLVGKWTSTQVTMTADQLSVEGGANVALSVADTGAAVLDFGPMAPIQGKSSPASFEFQYSGKASATLATKTRGAISSQSPDYSGLKVSVSFGMPGAGKVPLFKNKPVSELAQMATAMTGAKGAPAAAPPPGIDSSPVFSTSSYTCQGATLTLVSAKPAVTWSFKRAGG
jgi:hypothetical protein